MIVWLILLIPVVPAAAPDLHPSACKVWARLLPLAAAGHRRHEGRDPGPRENPAGRGSGRGEAPVALGDLRPAAALFDDPAYILKRELMWIPFFGWYAAKARCVPVDRRAGSKALVADERPGQGRGRSRAPDHHLSRKAPAVRRARPPPTSSASRISTRAGCPACRWHEFGPVLAAPPVHPPSRHDPRRNARSDPVRPFARRVLQAAAGADRESSNRLLDEGRTESASAPPPPRGVAVEGVKGDLTSWPGSSRPSRQGKARRATNRDHRHAAGDDESARSPRCAKNHANPSAAKLSAT